MDLDTFNNTCFYKLKNIPPIPDLFVASAEQAVYKTHDQHKQLAHSNTSVAKDFRSTKFCRILQNNFSINVDYFKNDPHSFYKFHKDAPWQAMPRTCSINIWLSGNPGAITMFSDTEINKLTNQVFICNYEKCVPFLFNSQIPHAVVNPFNEARYILSIGFHIAPYERVKKFLDETDFGHDLYSPA